MPHLDGSNKSARTHDTMGTDSQLPNRLAKARPADGDIERARVRAAMANRLLGASSPGVTLGRYVLVQPAGAGAMGMVYMAYDPELDRRVALKILEAAYAEGPDGKARMLREAQALARVSHPNIVAIHDVGMARGQVFIAMEFVHGQTLRSWLAAEPRPWRDVLEVLLQAARGLKAAHAAGLVHRDFKPENVMLGEDGRVRVMDFGLAKPDTHGADTDAQGQRQSSTAGRERPHRDALGERLTRTKGISGTPGYIAPEVAGGGPATASSDQYGFGVTLWEALVGTVPNATADLPDLETPAATRRVPNWLLEAAKRALAPEPSGRWTDMAAFIVALERGHVRRRRRRVAWVAGSVVVIGLGGTGWAKLARERSIATCEAAGAEISASWNPGVERDVRSGLTATGVTHTTSTQERLIPRLDDYANAWAETRTEACLDATVRNLWDAQDLERANWCLDDARISMEVVTTELAHATEADVAGSISRVAQLKAPRFCRDERMLEQISVPPQEKRAAVARLRERLARVAGLRRNGDDGAALAEVRTIRVEAEATDWSPLTLSVRASEADLMWAAGERAASEHLATAVYFQAARERQWELAASTALQLALAFEYANTRRDDAMQWNRHAEVALSHAGQARGVWESVRLGSVASLEFSDGDLESARVHFGEALKIREELVGRDHPATARALASVALVESNLANYDRAEELYQQAIASLESTLGPDHPGLSRSLNNLGVLYKRTGNFAEARKAYERALAIREAVYGPEHKLVGHALSNLANIVAVTGDAPAAGAMYERALRILEASDGPQSAGVAIVVANLAAHYADHGDFAAAKPLLERVLRINEEALGPDHARVGISYSNLALIEAELGNSERAYALAAKGLAVCEGAYEGDHPDIGISLAAMASVRLLANDPAAAEYFERALDLFGRDDAVPEEELETTFEFAQFLASTDAARARALALEAKAGFDAKGMSARRDAVDEWLGTHPQE